MCVFVCGANLVPVSLSDAPWRPVFAVVGQREGTTSAQCGSAAVAHDTREGEWVGGGGYRLEAQASWEEEQVGGTGGGGGLVPLTEWSPY